MLINDNSQFHKHQNIVHLPICYSANYIPIKLEIKQPINWIKKKMSKKDKIFTEIYISFKISNTLAVCISYKSGSFIFIRLKCISILLTYKSTFCKILYMFSVRFAVSFPG